MGEEMEITEEKYRNAKKKSENSTGKKCNI
jgi:hypothetical protein